MAISKVTLNGVTQMDVTQKTVTENTMLDGITSLKNDGTDITGNVQSKTSSDLTVNGANVTAPAGYYQSAATKSVAAGTEGTPVATKGSAKIGSWELGTISIGGAESSSSTRMRTNGYIELTNQIDISTTGTAQFSVRAYKADYSFVQTDSTWHSGTINVDSFLQSYSSYSQIKYIRFNVRYSTDATVVVSELEQLITVTDHTLPVTPSVTNSAGYITGGTKTGTAITVSASELVSGTKTVNAYGISDVTNYEDVFVGVPLVTGTFIGTTSGAMDVSIPYTGTGYPIALIICPTEGPYNSSTGSYYNLLGYWATAIFVGVKAEIDVAPQYGSNISANHMIILHRYKSSTSNPTQYSIQQGTSYMFNDTDATSGGISVVRLKTTTTMSVYFNPSGSVTDYGFAPNIEYTYYIVYSS